MSLVKNRHVLVALLIAPVLALIAAQGQGCGPYDAEIELAREWMFSMQDAAVRGMDAQSMAHLMIVVFIVLLELIFPAAVPGSGIELSIGQIAREEVDRVAEGATPL